MSFGLSSTDPIWLVLSILSSLVLAGIVLAFGRKLPRHGDWLVGIGLAAQAGALILSWTVHLAAGFAAVPWPLGWIWPRTESMAITVGSYRDTLGLVLSGWAVLAAALVAMNRFLIIREKRPERVYAAIALGSSGVTISCAALTPWLSFVGIAIASLGGVLALGSRWNTDAEANLAVRFARERGASLLLCVLGATALTSAGSDLVWGSSQAWASQPVNWMGAVLLASGLFLQLQPFPLLGLAVMPSHLVPAARIALMSMFPAMAAFVALIRLEPQLRQLGLFPAFGWVALGSAGLATVSSLLQKDWRSGLNCWISSALSVALAALAFAGASSGLGIFLGAVIASLVIAFLGSAAALSGAASDDAEAAVAGHAGGDFSGWVRLGIFMAAACGSGVVGFVSTSGAIGWLLSGVQEPGLAAAFAFIFFLLALAMWKLVWVMNRLIVRAPMPWLAVVAPYLLLLTGLGVVWVGTLSGGALPGDPDLVTASAVEAFFGKQGPQGEEAFLFASWLHWGAVVLAIVAAYWTAARRSVLWDRFHESFPRTAAFLAGGYGTDTAMRQCIAALQWVGETVQLAVDRKSWDGWIPNALNTSLQGLGRGFAALDGGFTARLDHTIRRGIEVPAKMLQLIQSGDVQWYLFFAIGSGIAILVHFLQI